MTWRDGALTGATATSVALLEPTGHVLSDPEAVSRFSRRRLHRTPEFVDDVAALSVRHAVREGYPWQTPSIYAKITT